MKKIVLMLFVSFFIFSGCGPSKNDELTTEQIVKEKERVKAIMEDYNRAFESESFSSIIETLSEDVVFFGSDSSEIIRSLSDFKNMIQKQWAEYDIKYGKMVDTWIDMDSKGTLASIIYGIPAKVTMKGETLNYFFRVARTLKKQDNRWLITSGIVGITQDMPKETKRADSTAVPSAK
jgi:ketosteroid isomerase-like protein